MSEEAGHQGEDVRAPVHHDEFFFKPRAPLPSEAAGGLPAPPHRRSPDVAPATVAATLWKLGRPLMIALAVMFAVNGSAATTEAGQDRSLFALITPEDRPTPRRAASSKPLGRPPEAPGWGTYAFLAVQPGTSRPVAYDPCRPLPYVVNPRTAPAGGVDMVAQAVARVEEVTGLRFAFEGLTDEPPSEFRAPFQPERYGDRWAPILIAWSDPAEVPRLGRDAIGIGGSAAVRQAFGGPTVYVTGSVVVDGPALGREAAAGRGWLIQRVLLHELSHVVGLDHVTDTNELMASGGTNTDFGWGDLAGLAQLGTGDCVDKL